MIPNNPVLTRIREALQNPAPMPGHHGASPAANASSPQPQKFTQWLPLVEDDLASQLDLFAKNSADLKTEFHLCDNRAEAIAKFQTLAKENDWKRIATHDGEHTNAAAAALGLEAVRTDAGYVITEMERCDAGITQCDALVAQTGSVLITALSAGGRALSVLPPHHVVFAPRTQMVPDLTAAYAVLREKYGSNFPSFISFITGPSRTGDIERILVLGAHGPKRLTVFCW